MPLGLELTLTPEGSSPDSGQTQVRGPRPDRGSVAPMSMAASVGWTSDTAGTDSELTLEAPRVHPAADSESESDNRARGPAGRLPLAAAPGTSATVCTSDPPGWVLCGGGSSSEQCRLSV